jgi:general secretion pathway protein B
MSYILEALKKADQERTAGNVPDLETIHRHAPASHKSYRWVWILAALFIFNGALVALLATRHDAGLGEVVVERPAALNDSGSALPEAARSQPPAEAATVVRKTPPRDAGTAPQPKMRGKAVVARPASALPQASTVQNQIVAPQVAVTPPEPTPAATPTPAPATAPVPATATAPGKISDWEDLPLDFRSGFTVPRMDVHVYDTDPQRRFVLVELQKYREGDRLPNGVVIEKILPDGIQLSYQGTSFHYDK